MVRLGYDFGSVAQHQGKLRIHIDLSAVKEKELNQQLDLYKSEFPNPDSEYEAYRKG